MLETRRGGNRLFTPYLSALHTKGELMAADLDKTEVSIGPWLTNPDTGRMTVNFVTAGLIGSGIEYRVKGADDSGWQLAWHQVNGQIQRTTFHAVDLANLIPGKLYEYRVIMIDPERPAEHLRLPQTPSTFRVPDALRDTISFFYTADLQFEPMRQLWTLETMMRAADADSCDFAVSGGDMSELHDEAEYARYMKLVARMGGPEKPIIIIRGNHELRGRMADRFPHYFANRDGLTYGVFRYGDTAFLCLDCWEDKPAQSIGALYCKYNLDDVFIKAEKDFLAAAVTTPEWTGARRRIVLAHAAPYSHYDSCMYMTYMLQDMTDPFFEGNPPKSSLNLWLAGHTHRYSRSIPGTNTIAVLPNPCTPCKGGTTYSYPVLTVGGPEGSQQYQATAFRIDIDSSKITATAYAEEGTCFEKVVYHDDGTARELLSLPHHDFPIPAPREDITNRIYG